MTYAYVIVIYVTYIQIYYYSLLGHGLPKDLWREISVEAPGSSVIYVTFLKNNIFVQCYVYMRSNS